MSEKSHPDRASSPPSSSQDIPEQYSERRRADVIASLREIVSKIPRDQMASAIQRNAASQKRLTPRKYMYSSSPYLSKEALGPASEMPMFDLTCLLLDEAERHKINIPPSVRSYRDARFREKQRLSMSMEDVLYGAMPGYPPVKCGNCKGKKVPCVPCYGNMSTCTSCKRLGKSCIPSASITRISGRPEHFTGSSQVSLPNNQVAKPQASGTGSKILPAPAKNTCIGEPAGDTCTSGQEETPSGPYHEIAHPSLEPTHPSTWLISREAIEPGIESPPEPETDHDDETAYPLSLEPTHPTSWLISRQAIEPGTKVPPEPETDYGDL